jgi:hypothetical protein
MTRSAGILLLLPFGFEYLRQHQFRLRQLRWDSVALLLLPVGIGLYALFCWWQFGDPLKFAHVQYHWNRVFATPWQNLWTSCMAIVQSKGVLSFVALYNLKELIPVLLILILLLLSIFGPWRLRKDQYVYIVYGLTLSYFNLSSMVAYGPYPMESQARYSLQIFPAFIILAVLGKHRIVHMTYLLASLTLMVGFLLQFLMGGWIT